MLEWLAPALGFMVAEGVLGITTKLALREISWQALLLWTAIAYAVLAIGLIAIGGETLAFGPGAGWAAASGLCAAGGLLLFMIALQEGEASRVVPVTAAYPVVASVLAALFLSESLDAPKALGTIAVVGGVVLLSRE